MKQEIARGEYRLEASNRCIYPLYAAQTKLLREQLPRDITVGNVDAFQGKEHDIIFVSLVRSNDRHAIGFMQDGRRFNVALTRARKALIVVGNAAFWLQCTEDSQSFVKHCQDVQCLIGEPLRAVAPSCSISSAPSRREDEKVTTFAMMTKALSLGFAALSRRDRIELVDQCFEAMQRLLEQEHFGALLHYVMHRPYKEYSVADRPQNIWAWDIKAWSHFGTITGLGVIDDPGNGAYACGLIVLCRAFGDIPSSWRKILQPYLDFCPREVKSWTQRKLEKFNEFAGDVLEAVAGLVSGKTQARDFCSRQGLTEDDAKEVLDLLSRWMSKVKRLSSYFETLDAERNIYSIWIQESDVRPHRCDFLESVLNRQICLSRITRSTSSNSSESRHVTLASSRASTRLRRTPAVRPPGDSRFTVRKQDRICICDRCHAVLEYQNKTQAFLGAYRLKNWNCYVEEEEKLWEAGKIDATFYCLACLAWYYDVDEDEANSRFLRNEAAYRQKRSKKWRTSQARWKRETKKRSREREERNTKRRKC